MNMHVNWIFKLVWFDWSNFTEGDDCVVSLSFLYGRECNAFVVFNQTKNRRSFSILYLLPSNWCCTMLNSVGWLFSHRNANRFSLTVGQSISFRVLPKWTFWKSSETRRATNDNTRKKKCQIFPTFLLTGDKKVIYFEYTSIKKIVSERCPSHSDKSIKKYNIVIKNMDGVRCWDAKLKKKTRKKSCLTSFVHSQFERYWPR